MGFDCLEMIELEFQRGLIEITKAESYLDQEDYDQSNQIFEYIIKPVIILSQPKENNFDQ
jgi:hypothetical protein